MVYLLKLEPGEQATCACECQVEVFRSDTPQVPVAGTSREGEKEEDEDMDTGDGADLLKGSTKLVPQFSKLCYNEPKPSHFVLFQRQSYEPPSQGQ